MANIIEKEISSACKEDMEIYGSNINLSRAIADERDSLKPVERRLIYTMFVDKKLSHNVKKSKVASITGTVMDKYHPHGDPTDTLCLMGQSWKFNIPLIDGQGNFGSISGDKHGAPRYIEARLTKYACECFFEDLKNNSVDYIEAANKVDEIAEYLPAKYPNILINGSSGIGYAKASFIPPHNFKEVVMATIALMNDPDIDVTLYPDSPSGCLVLDKDRFHEICDKGRGSFRMRANTEIKNMKINGRMESVIHVTSLPYRIEADVFENKIEELVKKEKKIQFIKDIHNDSKKAIVDIKIILKKGVNPYTALQKLFSATKLEETYSVMYETIRGLNTKSHNLKSLLMSWILFRRDTKIRMINNSIVKIKTRLAVLDGLMQMLTTNKFDDIMARLRKECSNKADTTEFLIKEFNISDLQAEKIAEMQIYNINMANYNKYNAEREEKEKTIKSLMEIRKNKKLIDDIIKSELVDGMDKYGWDRKSDLITTEEANNIVPKTKHKIYVTKGGFVKKLVKGSTSIGRLPQGDSIIGSMDNIANDASIYAFTNLGTLYRIDLGKIDSTMRESNGTDIREQLDLGYNEEILYVTAFKDKFKYLLFATQNGFIKKTETKVYNNFKNKSLMSIKLADGDQLVSVLEVNTNKTILLYSTKGKCMVMSAREVKDMGRMTMGMKSMELSKGDTLQGVNVIGKDHDKIFVVTEKGRGKKCSLNMGNSGRKGEVYNLTSLHRGDLITKVLTFKDGEGIIVKTQKGSITDIDTRELENATRISKCEKLIPVPTGDRILKIEKVA